MWYGFRAWRSGELISFGGRTIVHDDPDEALFLLAGVAPVPLGPDYPIDTLKLTEHPELGHLSWPLERSMFR